MNKRDMNHPVPIGSDITVKNFLNDNGPSMDGIVLDMRFKRAEPVYENHYNSFTTIYMCEFINGEEKITKEFSEDDIVDVPSVIYQCPICRKHSIKIHRIETNGEEYASVLIAGGDPSPFYLARCDCGLWKTDKDRRNLMDYLIANEVPNEFTKAI